jgi:hypothetical protein
VLHRSRLLQGHFEATAVSLHAMAAHAGSGASRSHKVSVQLDPEGGIGVLHLSSSPLHASSESGSGQAGDRAAHPLRHRSGGGHRDGVQGSSHSHPHQHQHQHQQHQHHHQRQHGASGGGGHSGGNTGTHSQPLLALLGVPTDMPIADLLRFLAPWRPTMVHLRELAAATPFQAAVGPRVGAAADGRAAEQDDDATTTTGGGGSGDTTTTASNTRGATTNKSSSSSANTSTSAGRREGSADGVCVMALDADGSIADVAAMDADDGYSVLVRLSSESAAVELATALRGKPWSSLEPDRVAVVHRVLHIDGASSGKLMLPEPAIGQCPICLDELAEATSDVVTRLCSHSFHAECLISCLARCASPRCPICRWAPPAPGASQCHDNCVVQTGLWMCLVCGHLGCGRQQWHGSSLPLPSHGHALKHYERTGHVFTKSVDTSQVSKHHAFTRMLCISTLCFAATTTHTHTHTHAHAHTHTHTHAHTHAYTLSLSLTHSLANCFGDYVRCGTTPLIRTRSGLDSTTAQTQS